MTLDIQFKLKNNPMCLTYLHQNSNWYKILNRNPNSFSSFLEEMKARYKLRPQDKIDKVINALDVLNTIMELR